MPRLILLNGPPACGKSTLARRYVEEHPLALALDIDRIRDLIGGWSDHAQKAGLLARSIALAGARAHLRSGHDVVVPQLLAAPTFIEQAATLANDLDCAFHEVVLVDSKENAVRRYIQRASTGRDHAHGGIEETPARQAELVEVEALHDRLIALVATRPATKLVHIRDGDVDRAYQDLLDALV